MKIKRKLKKIMILSGTIFLLCTSITACGSSPETSEAEENNNNSARNTESADPISKNPEEDSQGTGADGKNSQAPDTEEMSSLTGSEDGNTNETSDGNSGKWHVLDPEIAKRIDADFQGSVRKIEVDSFFISEMKTEILEDNSLLCVDPSSTVDIPDSDLLKIIYDDNTRFYTRTIYNGGESYEDNEATSDSLELDCSVSLKGNITDDVFYADEVRISIIK